MPSGKTPAEVLAVLRGHPLFAALPAGWETTLADIETITVPAGATLAAAGNSATHLFVLLEGHAKVFIAIGDRPEGTVDILEPGDVFGECAITGIGTYTASVVALDPLTAVRVPGASIRTFLNDDPRIVMAMMAAMAVSLRGLLNQLAELKLKTTAQRLAMYLIELAGGPNTPTEVALPVSKRVIAMKLGMTPETLSRAMGKLEPYGVHPRDRGRVALDDPMALSDFCGFWTDEGTAP